jgi:LysM repeat protein
MKPLALLALSWLGLTAQDTAVVGPNETLRQVAERTLGDASAAEELRALNGLRSDTVAEGTRLKVPGQDRALANKALETARTLVAQAKHTATLAQAEVRLKEAETHFRAARYAQASEAANAAGKLVAAAPASQPSTFSVEVADGGSTTVKVTQGPPVRVQSEGVIRPVAKGESLRVEPGSPPPAPLAALAVPRPAQPEDGMQLKLKPDKEGRLGPVKLAWAAVPGAERYEVEVVNEVEATPALAQPVTLAATEMKLPALPAGRYRWTVRALGPEGRSEASAPRRFELVVDRLKLEVQTGKWQ